MSHDGYPTDLFQEIEVKDARRGLRGTYGLVNFERQLQDLEIANWTALLEHKNAYTGLRYWDDPALAVVELHNEDCVFFHFPLGPQFANSWQWLPKSWQNARLECNLALHVQALFQHDRLRPQQHSTEVSS